MIGFALHNTTEGIAVVAPSPDSEVSAAVGRAGARSAGDPQRAARLGRQPGRTVAFLLGVGVGAILQVIAQIAPRLRDRATDGLDPLALSGVAGGVLVMYGTGLLVA